MPDSSTQKVLAFLEYIGGLPDDDLQQMAPFVAPAMARGAIALMASQIPDDPEALDSLLQRAAAFAISMRSDDAPPPVFEAPITIQGEAAELPEGEPDYTEELPADVDRGAAAE
jgi:hypothetical protein